MANETISTSIDELSIIAVNEARFVASNRQDLTRLLTMREVQEGAISVRVPKYANLTAAAQSNEGQDISNTEFTTSGVVFTPGVNAAISTVFSDLAVHNAPQLVADAARIAADAILKKKNADIWALFDGFSTSIGTSDTDINVALVRQGVKKLMQANARGDITLAITPEVWEDLQADMASASGGYNTMVSDNMRDAINQGALDVRIPILGCNIVVVTSGISETGDVKCGLFTREALGYAYAWDFKAEFQRRSKAVGWDFTVSAAYEVKELEDSFGVELLVDGADA